MIWLAWLCGGVHVKGGDYGIFYRTQPQCWRLLIRHTLRRTQFIIVLSERLRDMFAFRPNAYEAYRSRPERSPFRFERSAARSAPRAGAARPTPVPLQSDPVQGVLRRVGGSGNFAEDDSDSIESHFRRSLPVVPRRSSPMSPERAEARFHEYVAAKTASRTLFAMWGRSLAKQNDAYLKPAISSFCRPDILPRGASIHHRSHGPWLRRNINRLSSYTGSGDRRRDRSTYRAGSADSAR